MTVDEAMQLTDAELARAVADAMGWTRMTATSPGSDNLYQVSTDGTVCRSTDWAESWHPFAPCTDPRDAAEVERWLAGRPGGTIVFIDIDSEGASATIALPGGKRGETAKVKSADPVAAKYRCLAAVAVAVAGDKIGGPRGD